MQQKLLIRNFCCKDTANKISSLGLLPSSPVFSSLFRSFPFFLVGVATDTPILSANTQRLSVNSPKIFCNTPKVLKNILAVFFLSRLLLFASTKISSIKNIGFNFVLNLFIRIFATSIIKNNCS